MNITTKNKKVKVVFVYSGKAIKINKGKMFGRITPKADTSVEVKEN